MNTFNARIIKGSGRGKTLGYPTINLNLDDIPSNLEEGVYACLVNLNNEWHQAVFHFGNRPTFGDLKSGEIFVLDKNIKRSPNQISVQVLEKIREIKKFASSDDLKKQIEDDISQARDMLEEDV